MKHLRLFETETDYDSEVSEFEYPTVSFVQDVEDVRYMLKPPHDYSQDYLTFEALESGTFTFGTQAQDVRRGNSVYISYSLDNGNTWVQTYLDDLLTSQLDDLDIVTVTTPTVSAGSKVMWKGWLDRLCYDNIRSTCRFNASGNVGSIMRGEEVEDWEYWGQSTYEIDYLFYGTSTLVSAKNLYLDYSYQSNNSTFTCNGFGSFFYQCTSLTEIPTLPTTLKSGCFSNMFAGCTSLASVPANLLPATTLANNCYRAMFINTALTTAPELPATTLVTGCYNNMFERCSSLSYIKAMFTTTPSNTYTQNWVMNVSSTGTFVKNSAAQWNVTSNYGIPSGWTVETASE